MLVSEAEKKPEDRIRKTSMPNSTLIGMSLKKNQPLVAIRRAYFPCKCMEMSRG